MAAIAIVVVKGPSLAVTVLAAALVVAGHALRRSRSVQRHRVLIAGRVVAIGLGVMAVIALGAERLHDQRVVHDIRVGLPMVSALLVLAAMVIATLPAADNDEVDQRTRQMVDTIAHSDHGDLCAPFSRRHDKRYVWSADGLAFVGFRTVFGVCVSGPGPVGDPAAVPDALEAWLELCADRGWRPMMIGADDRVRSLAERDPTTGRRRMRALHFGDEVVVHVPSIELNTPRMRNVRQAVQRSKNAGVEVTVQREGSLSGELRRELLDVVDEWENGRGTYGYSMTMDHLLDGTYGDALLVVAHHQGRVVGFQRWFEARGGAGLTLDVMPRRRHCPNGVNERLIIETAQWAAANTTTDLSLNFAAFRSVFESNHTLRRAAAYRVVHLLDRFLDVESLYRFNAKFHPTWHARHVLFESLFDVPLVVAAAVRLEFGRRPERASADAYEVGTRSA